MADQYALELEVFPSEGEHDSGAAETDADTGLDRPASPQDEQGKLLCAKRFGGCSVNLTQRRA